MLKYLSLIVSCFAILRGADEAGFAYGSTSYASLAPVNAAIVEKRIANFGLPHHLLGTKRGRRESIMNGANVTAAAVPRAYVELMRLVKKNGVIIVTAANPAELTEKIRNPPFLCARPSFGTGRFGWRRDRFWG